MRCGTAIDAGTPPSAQPEIPSGASQTYSEPEAPSGHMFAGVWTLEKQRSPLQAVGFYLVHAVTAFMVIVLLGVTEIFGTTFEEGMQAGQVLAILYSASLGFLVAYKKSDTRTTIAVLSISAIAAYALGLLLGVIPAAYMTTRPSADGGA